MTMLTVSVLEIHIHIPGVVMFHLRQRLSQPTADWELTYLQASSITCILIQLNWILSKNPAHYKALIIGINVALCILHTALHLDSIASNPSALSPCECVNQNVSAPEKTQRETHPFSAERICFPDQLIYSAYVQPRDPGQCSTLQRGCYTKKKTTILLQVLRQSFQQDNFGGRTQLI